MFDRAVAGYQLVNLLIPKLNTYKELSLWNQIIWMLRLSRHSSCFWISEQGGTGSMHALLLLMSCSFLACSLLMFACKCLCGHNWQRCLMELEDYYFKPLLCWLGTWSVYPRPHLPLPRQNGAISGEHRSLLVETSRAKWSMKSDHQILQQS